MQIPRRTFPQDNLVKMEVISPLMFTTLEMEEDLQTVVMTTPIKLIWRVCYQNPACQHLAINQSCGEPFK